MRLPATAFFFLANWSIILDRAVQSLRWRPRGATARVVGEIGEIVADPSDADASANALLTAFGLPGMGEALKSPRDRYSARATAAALGAVLDEISA
jgi:hypothetical protein